MVLRTSVREYLNSHGLMFGIQKRMPSKVSTLKGIFLSKILRGPKIALKRNRYGRDKTTGCFAKFISFAVYHYLVAKV
jgi:hypothetical protein